ncbi:Mannose-1-phosphate guanylyltransferase (GDP) [Caenispirillum salinarum AK4]|uniref:mannose-1-phosphate guanylyltransferase n=1 Tax=Caenispirillum salinarum AK4 TaxID=1238182 RepID=K9HFD8_9PROT|nr:mannose-1-phosphate guanylyltransferase/mannose-6-phosphate isomerase [Caenispirillum salinarum]EKV27396.1 Mannose-1-phosphate guanylyltransferase (GDP) [Caenispirillum salinarum AK4]
MSVRQPSSGIIHPVILSGGAGTRLWPLSRESRPKQLRRLLGDRTLLQDTARRAGAWAPPLIVSNAEHRFQIAEQMRQAGIAPRAIVIEPSARNTAPAAAVAALMLGEEDPSARMLVMPSDHAIHDTDAFRATVEACAAAAGEDRLACLGVTPTRPHTGYGYVERAAEPIAPGVAPVIRFVEKPDADRAKAFVESGNFLWNAGIFLFPVAVYLDALAETRPDMLALCRAAVAQGQQDLDFLRLAPEPFNAIKGDSIDYAVMEHARDAVVAELDAGWSDIGSWSSLHEESESDADGNALVGDVTAMDCAGSYLRSEDRLLVAIGIEDLVVVAEDDAVLVARKGDDQRVKDVVADLKARGRKEATENTCSYRPWGTFQTIDEGPRFHVKHIMVKQGESLSLQMHHHRSEHWIVVEGTAEVTRDDETFLLFENESVFIRTGQTHRLCNPGKLPLRLIEVQSGPYCGEDDIVRFTDAYGRIEPLRQG